MATKRTYTIILRGDPGEHDIIVHVLATDFKLRAGNVINSYEFYNGPACVAAFCACDVKRITSEINITDNL